MDPALRLLHLLSALQQRPEWSSAELADDLGVTTRTLRRDVTRLRELGYAVDATPGRGGGYRLRAGSGLPPLVLDDDEAVVLAVGLRVAALSGISGSADAAVSALAKLEGILPPGLRARAAALGADVVTLVDTGAAGTDPAVLATVALASRRREYLALKYTDGVGRTSHRLVGAHQLVHTGRRWYLVGYDTGRRDWRTFRVDRIASAEPRGGRPDYPDPPDAATFVAEAITTAPYRWAATVRLELPLAAARRSIPPTFGRLTEETSTTTQLRLGADDLDWLARYLVGLNCPLEILDPPELHAAVVDLGRQLSRSGQRIEPPA